MEDVTDKLLGDIRYAIRGDDVKRVQNAAPAKSITPALEAELDRLRDPRTDCTMGYISNALAYANSLRRDKRRHANIIRLIKGGFVRVVRVDGSPPAGSHAAHDARFSHSYYKLEVV